jgi:hypothetical protein
MTIVRVKVKKGDLPKGDSAVIAGVLQRRWNGAGSMTKRNRKRRNNPKNNPIEDM